MGRGGRELSYPKIRDDLTFSRQESAGGPIFVVKERAAGNFFRFGELERFIIDQCDGTTPVETIRQRVEERFGASLPEAVLHRFLVNLRRAGLLETGGGAGKRTPGRRSRFGGSPLYLRFRVCNPDRLLGRLETWMRFAFSAPFVAVSAASILSAVAVAVSDWSQVSADFFRIYRPSVIPVLLLVVFLIASAHELAHGLTCKHFGGEVPELGVMLTYLQPALYCNVSDAWLFPDKGKRLWVGAAGPYFELFLWSIATLAWRVTEPDTWINTLGYIGMTVSGIKSIVNFNPLLKFDGYYLLSDYLGMPNLRRRAFAYSGGWIKRLGGAPRLDTMTPRERRICLIYGLAAAVFSIGFLGAAFAKIGRYLAHSNQPLGFAVLGGVLVAKMRRRFRRMFPASRGSVDDDDDFDSPESPAEPSGDAGQGRSPAEPSAPVKREHARTSRMAKALIIAAAAIGIAFLGRWDLKIHGPFLVLPIQNADLRAEVDGMVEAVHVHEGDRARKGDPIAELSDRDLAAELQKAEADIEQSRAKLELLQAGPTPEEEAAARAEVAKAEDHLRHARERLAMDKAMYDSLLISRRDLLTTQEEAATAENDLVAARSKLELLVRGARPEEIAATRAEIKGLESQREYLEEQLQLLHMISPVTGVVATPSTDLEEMKHRVVHKGDLIVKVYECRTVTAKIPVSEHDIADVRVGSKVLLKARAYPNKTFEGVVTAVATAAEGSAAGVEAPASAAPPRRENLTPSQILVTTEIDNPSLQLKPGMTGEAKIIAGRKPVLELLSRWLSHAVKVEFWSWA